MGEDRDGQDGYGRKYPLGDSNPCFRTENPTSWASRRRGQTSSLSFINLSCTSLAGIIPFLVPTGKPVSCSKYQTENPRLFAAAWNPCLIPTLRIQPYFNGIVAPREVESRPVLRNQSSLGVFLPVIPNRIFVCRWLCSLISASLSPNLLSGWLRIILPAG